MHFPALWQAKFNAAFNLKVAENYIYSYEMHKTVATRAAPFGPDMHKLFVGWGFAPDPTGGASYSAPSDSLAGLGGGTSPGKGKRNVREGRFRWDWDPSIQDGQGMEGRMGVRGGEGKEGRGGRGNKHTRFKTCGAAHGRSAFQPLLS